MNDRRYLHHLHGTPDSQRKIGIILVTLSLLQTTIRSVNGLSTSFLPLTTVHTSSSSSASCLQAFPNYSNRRSGDKQRGTNTGTNPRNDRSKQKFRHTDDEERGDEGTTILTTAPSPLSPPRRRHPKGQRTKRPTYLSPSTLFTLEHTAPPLHPVDVRDYDANVVSPTILLRNELECDATVCGPLPVTYTNDPETIGEWLEEHVKPADVGDRYSYVGFDVESVVSWRKHPHQSFSTGPATIQISTPSSSLVIHLTSRPSHHRHYRHTPTIPPPTHSCKPLLSFLSDPTILKCGAGIDADAMALYLHDPTLLTAGRLDIGGIGCTSVRRKVGLRNLVRAAVGVDLPKSRSTACSDWSRIPLGNGQVCYAGRDAWAGACVVRSVAESFPSSMGVNAMGDRLLGVGGGGRERGMEEVWERRERREMARDELRSVVGGKKVGLVKGGVGVRMEAERLRRIVEETTPDCVPMFRPDEYGLDFAFDDINMNVNAFEGLNKKLRP